MQILERMERIEERLIHQSDLIGALQHSSEVARAEREAIIIELARTGGQITEIKRLSEDISRKIYVLSSVQESIRENLKDQALDITLLKKIISL